LPLVWASTEARKVFGELPRTNPVWRFGRKKDQRISNGRAHRSISFRCHLPQRAIRCGGSRRFSGLNKPDDAISFSFCARIKNASSKR
jgi:hypothetical protein